MQHCFFFLFQSGMSVCVYICVWARLRIVPTLCQDSSIVSPLRLLWVKGVRVFRFDLPPALLAEWPGSFTCHCGNTGVERTLNKSQHTKLIQEKTILPPLLPGFELATFRSQVRRSYKQAIPAPCTYILAYIHSHSIAIPLKRARGGVVIDMYMCVRHWIAAAGRID